MTQKGEHTWDLVWDYERCPKCGYIIESREGFQFQNKSWIKEICCSRCGVSFTLKQKPKSTFGPIFGQPQPPEITWD